MVWVEKSLINCFRFQLWKDFMVQYLKEKLKKLLEYVDRQEKLRKIDTTLQEKQKIKNFNMNQLLKKTSI